MGYDVIFVHESATDVLESVGGFQQRWVGTPKIIDLQYEILIAQMAAERRARRTASEYPAELAVIVLVDCGTLSSA